MATGDYLVNGILVRSDGAVYTTTTANMELLAASSGSSLVGHIASGAGAVAETVQGALRRLVHTAQYSTQGNYETARDALTGTIGVQNLDVAGLLQFPALPGPAVIMKFATSDANAADFNYVQYNTTFNGTVDCIWGFGYNLSGTTRQDTSEPSLAFTFEHNFNNGSANLLECNIGGQHSDGTSHRPWGVAINRSTKVINHTFEGDIDFFDSTHVNQAVIVDITPTTSQWYWSLGSEIRKNGNNATFLSQQNAAGNAYISLIRLNASNRVTLGPDGTIVTFGSGNTFLFEDTGGGNARIATTTILTLDAAQTWLRSADGATTFWKKESSGHITAGTDNIYDIGASEALRPRTGYFGTSLIAPFLRTSNAATGAAVNDTVQFYGSDDAAGHTIPSFYCEGTNVIATGQADSASSVRVKMRINGTVVTLLAI